MRDDDTNERSDPGPGDPEADDPVRGFHLDVGLGLLSGLLGNLLDGSARRASSPPGIPRRPRTAGNRSGHKRVGGATSGHERAQRAQRGRSDEYLIDTRIDDDEFIVTADIPGATRDDLSVGIRQRTNNLVIGRNGTVIRRVDLPWLSPEATRVWFHNGVLEVRLQPDDT